MLAVLVIRRLNLLCCLAGTLSEILEITSSYAHISHSAAASVFIFIRLVLENPL